MIEDNNVRTYLNGFNPRNVPLAVLEVLLELEKKIPKDLNLDHKILGSYLLVVNEIDKVSNFYFKIKSAEILQGQIHYNIEYLPMNEMDISIFNGKINFDPLKHCFESWLNILYKYKKIEEKFNDPIVQFYYREVEEELNNFDIIDDDKNDVPFSSKQQEKIIHLLDIIIEKASEINTEITEEIIQDSNNLKETISSEVKAKSFEKFKIILAKVKKWSFNIAKEIMVKVIANIVSNVLIGHK